MMTDKARKLGLWRDSQAQALTEFAIVIPVVLMMFFTIVQYLNVVLASQLGTYAAYAAARSYAVNLMGGTDADTKAQLAASMAYSSLSYPFEGEAAYHSALDFEQYMRSLMTGMGVPSDYATKAFAMLSGSTRLGGLGGSIDGVPAPMMKCGIAWGRMGFFSKGLESSAPPKKGGKTLNLPQRTVILRYQLPLWLPGFREMWNFVQGDTLETAFAGRIGPHPTVEVASICTMGLEIWGGTVKLAGAGDSSQPADTPLIDLSLELQEQQERFDNALDQIDAASRNHDNATDEYNECKNDPDRKNCNAEKESMDYWAGQEDYWRDEAQAAQDEMTRIRGEITDYGNSQKP